MLSLAVFAAILALSLGVEPDLGRECKPGEKGSAGIKFYVDHDRNEAYPFYYKGCGGDNNRFDTLSAASSLMALDRQFCPGWGERSDSCSDGPHPPEKKCKEGWFCQRSLMGNGGGSCCEKAAEEKLKLNRLATCPGGMNAHKDADGIVFGRKCSHNFCPKGSTCVDGVYEAYCCKK